MPQLDLFSFSSQIFWLTFIFWGLYVVIFTTFVYPFSFILKIRAYITTVSTPVLVHTSTSFRFNSSNEQDVSSLFSHSFKLQNYLSNSKSMSTKIFYDLIHLSGDNFHKSTDFESFKTVSVVENFLKH